MMSKVCVSLSKSQFSHMDTFIHRLEESSFGKFCDIGASSILHLNQPQKRLPLTEIKQNDYSYYYSKYNCGNSEFESGKICDFSCNDFQILSIKGSSSLQQESVKFSYFYQNSKVKNIGEMTKSFSGDYMLRLHGFGTYYILRNGLKRYFYTN